jgi:5-methylcytosine-specific restriction endonuclease McrBC regulatory subunit McrC
MITNIKKTNLLEVIRENRNEHKAIFDEAVEGYKKKAVELLEQHIDRIKRSSLERVSVSIPVPQDHSRDYDRVIAMIEKTEDEVVELEEHEFAQYVLDDWAWQREFLATNSAYSSMALDKSGRM